MKNARRLTIALSGCVVAVIVLGLIISSRFGPGSNDHSIRVHVVSIDEQATSLQCSWQFTTTDRWTWSGGGGTFPESHTTFRRDSQPHNLLRDSRSHLIQYDLALNLRPARSSRMATLTEQSTRTVDGESAANGGGSSSWPTKDMRQMTSVLMKNDTTISTPGRYVLATIDGNPVTIEFTK